MITSTDWTFAGTRDRDRRPVVARPRSPHRRYVALLVHGYGEHIGRYDHVAAALVDHGAVVYGLDHIGHGKSGGERVIVEDFDDVVDRSRHRGGRAARATGRICPWSSSATRWAA